MLLEIDHTPKLIQTFTEDLGQGTFLTMVLIPPGEFMMGSSPTEYGYNIHESPCHKVTIAQPFFLGQYPITQAQWRRVAKMPQVNFKLRSRPSRFSGNDLPVEQVSWQDAQEFCDRLSAHTNHHYQLPAEAQWEYACRAGSKDSFHFGKTISTQIVNYNGQFWENRDVSDQEINREKTTLVGGFGVANDFGLYDMHGNVWEWCEDSWHDRYEDAPIDGSPWIDQDERIKVLRGGSWFYEANYCRSAGRDKANTNAFSDNCGFRVMYAPSRNN